MNSFYKVRYIGKEESLLEKVTISNFYLCYGIKDGKLLIYASEAGVDPYLTDLKQTVKFGDVNGDGTVDIADFVSILNIMAEQ